jgi:hypothetical protein
MRFARLYLIAARLFFLSYVLFTATYCLLAFIPFTYQQVHVGELLPWLTRFVRLHALIYWPAFAAISCTIWPGHRRVLPRRVAHIFLGLGVLVGLGLLIHPLLPNLKNDSSSLVWCLLSLVPLLYVAVIDWLYAHNRFSWQTPSEEETSHLIAAALEAALYSAALYFTIVFIRIWNTKSLPYDASQWTSVLLWSLCSHLLVFFLIFVLLDLALVVATALRKPAQTAKAAGMASLVVVAMLIALALRFAVLPTLAFDGPAATAVSVALAVALVAFMAASSLRLLDSDGTAELNAIQLLVFPLQLLRRLRWMTRPVLLGGLAIIALVLSNRVSRLDWGFMLQKMAVMVVWTAAFAIFYSSASRLPKITRPIAYSAGLFVLLCYIGLVVAQPRRMADSNSSTAIGEALDGFEGFDISFRLADQALLPRVTPHASASGSFYSYLAQNTNIPRSVHVTPVDIKLVSDLAPDKGPKPNIFFIVIDSLRRDYLSPYNADVTFTPAIDSFAHDSIVFQNAFTRYGGTGLSEPSIWVGGVILHQQYESPFGPMNSLQKLLDVNHYREWISKDNVLQQVVPDSKNIDELDKNIGAMHYDLCQTLDELSERVRTAPASPDPIFVYTQAQNIHVSVIDREGRSVVPGASLPTEFNAPYASRLQKMDGCLGKFFSVLKAKGLYDNSIIVLTSDHGDSLGEDGRWGHAYTIFPEIVRIPLIVHLPAPLRASLQDDPQSVAFLTDLTPSLYYLLGQKSLLNNPLFGHPLFTESLEEQKRYRSDSQLLISSYGPVYGLLSDNGRHLYIADGVNYRDYAYELSPDGSSKTAAMTDEQRSAAQQRIREQVSEIATYYGLQ